MVLISCEANFDQTGLVILRIIFINQKTVLDSPSTKFARFLYY